jgi:hypothetical protein
VIRKLAGRRGSVSVELALVSAFFLLPLTLGSIDMLYVLTQRFQMHRALQSLYFYAWSNPSNAGNQTDVQSALTTAAQSTIAGVTLASAPTTTYDCASNQQSASPSALTTTQPTCSTTNPLQTFVTYSITATVKLPVPIPGFATSYPLNLTGTIQVS